MDVRVPSSHQRGVVEYPSAGQDNRAAFGAAGLEKYDNPLEMLSSISNIGVRDDTILIFIHGFNNTMAEGLYRHAQIAHDLSLTGPQVSYSWPSEASSVGYLADRDSVAIARDGLERLIRNLAARQDRKIRILAHSMGSMLLMETLRQMSIGGHADSFDALAGVVLISPDINIDLFERQVERIDNMPKNFLVAVSTNDRALRLSQLLAGNVERLGSSSDLERLKALGVDVLDLSDFDDGESGGHSTLVSSPAALELIVNLRRAALANRSGNVSKNLIEISENAGCLT